MADKWEKSDSDIYRKLAHVAVPARAEQIATLLTLIPFRQDEHFKVVELASGEGLLSAAILELFPLAQIIAMDYETSMQVQTTERLKAYTPRFTVVPFDIQRDYWFSTLDGVQVVISSLCIHHLTATGKQNLFNQVYQRLSADGAFLIADLVEASTAQAHELFATSWDQTVKSTANNLNQADLHQLFQAEHWNYYRYPDEIDKPSTLFEQLTWLKDAGFSAVDAFWMQAGHAIFGGYKVKRTNYVSYELALHTAKKILN